MTKQPFRARFGFDAENQKLVNLADATQLLDGVNLQTLQKEAGFHFAGRIGDLPSPQDPDPLKRPINGRAYLVKLDLRGNPIDRIAVWDASQAATGGVAAVDVIEPAADAAAITAAVGTTDSGKPFTAGAGTNAVISLLANADGSITGTVTAPGSGYSIGDQMVVPASSLAWPNMTGDTTVVVTQLTGASPTGGWRFVDPQIFLRALSTDPAPAPGAAKGDLEVTTEKDHTGFRIWDGSAWQSVLDADTIKGWIASLALFQGTVQENGGTVVGALDFAALPDISDPIEGAKHVSQYWVWVGTAGYTVKPGDPNGVGADVANAVLQVGDWLQVGSRGVAPSLTYHWSIIGGDLLAKSRADSLYGLRNFVAGNYEKDTTTVYQGKLYRATAAVTNADPVPGATGSPWAVIPLDAGVKSVASDTNLPATAPAGEVYIVLNSAIGGGQPTLYSYDPGAAAWVQLGIDALAKLSDTNITSPADKQVLVYDATNSEWKNQAQDAYTKAEMDLKLTVPAKIVAMTAAAYNALGVKDANTLYVLT
jgi:hypothetical protein